MAVVVVVVGVIIVLIVLMLLLEDDVAVGVAIVGPPRVAEARGMWYWYWWDRVPGADPMVVVVVSEGVGEEGRGRAKGMACWGRGESDGEIWAVGVPTMEEEEEEEERREGERAWGEVPAPMNCLQRLL